MTAITMKHFDTLGFVKKSKALGVKEEVAEFQAKQLEEIFDATMSANEIRAKDIKDLVTKKDLELQIGLAKKDLKSEIELVKKDLRSEIELAKKDLKLEMASSKIQIISWVAGLFVASGLFQHFFK